MIPFLKKAFFFFLYIIMVVYLLTIDWVPYKKKSTFIYAAFDKQNLIEKSNKKPKVYFTGGSGIAFGLDTKKIINLTNLNCINLGLNGGLGAKFYLDQLIYSAKKNDIILIFFEYGLPFNGFGELLGDIDELPFINLNFSQFIDFKKNCYFRNYRYYIENRFVENSLYSRSGFNELGDFIGHWEEPNRLIEKKKYEINYVNYIDELNDFNKIMNEKGIKVYFIYPPIRESCFKISKEYFSESIKEFENIVEIPILSSIEENIFPDSLFFDTKHHLNIQGVQNFSSFVAKKLFQISNIN